MFVGGVAQASTRRGWRRRKDWIDARFANDSIPAIDCVHARFDEKKQKLADPHPNRDSPVKRERERCTPEKERVYTKRRLKYVKFRLRKNDLQQQLGFFKRDPDSSCPFNGFYSIFA